MLQQPLELEKELPPCETATSGEAVRLVKVVCNFEAGGTEGQVFNLVRRLDPARFAVEMVCLQKSGPYLREYEQRDIPIHEFPLSSLLGPRAWLRMLRFAAWLRSRRVQIVHAYNFYALVFALPAARLAGVPVVLGSIRDRGVYLSPMQKRVQRWACGFAHELVVNADSIRDWLRAEGYTARRIQVIKNGIDLSLYEGGGDSLRAELGLGADAPLVVMVARLNRRKGVEEFIRAAAEVAHAQPEARFLLVGRPSGESLRRRDDGGSDYDDWQRLCRELGAQDRILFLGNRTDVPRLLAGATLSVLPSYDEGLSNTLLESMAAGLPIVATRVGGTPELIEDGANGLLVPPRDARALAAAMRQVLDDPGFAARLAAAARRRAAAEFSLEHMVDATGALYAARLRGKMSEHA